MIPILYYCVVILVSFNYHGQLQWMSVQYKLVKVLKTFSIGRYLEFNFGLSGNLILNIFVFLLATAASGSPYQQPLSLLCRQRYIPSNTLLRLFRVSYLLIKLTVTGEILSFKLIRSVGEKVVLFKFAILPRQRSNDW